MEEEEDVHGMLLGTAEAPQWQYTSASVVNWLTLLLYEGNEDLREMTKHRRYLLRIDFSPDGEFYTEYDNFTIGSESDHYPLHANYVAPDGNRKDAGQ